jgi:NDP-sugar pyrophosphorylase family protein
MTQNTHPVTGIVLAGTYPWKKSALTSLFPRPLLPVALRPLVLYAITSLHDAGIRGAAICARQETRALKTKVAAHVPADMQLSFHEDASPRGTAGAIRDAAMLSDCETFVVVEGTAVPTAPLCELLAAHHASGAAITVAVHDDRRATGPALQVSTGTYVISRHALDTVPPTGFCDLKETLIPRLHRAGARIAAFGVAEPSARVMDNETYLAVNGWMVERLAAQGVATYERVGDALVHQLAHVAQDAVLVGPVMVGRGAHIGSGAIIVGPCTIGHDATIEGGAMVSRSAIWRRSHVREFAIVDRTILTDGATVQPATRLYRSVAVADPRAAARPAAAADTTSAWHVPRVVLLRRMARAVFTAETRTQAVQ